MNTSFRNEHMEFSLISMTCIRAKYIFDDFYQVVFVRQLVTYSSNSDQVQFNSLRCSRLRYDHK